MQLPISNTIPWLPTNEMGYPFISKALLICFLESCIIDLISGIRTTRIWVIGKLYIKNVRNQALILI